MGFSAMQEDTGVPQANRAPACQWSFNRARQFHHISGDSSRFFHRIPAELLRQHVSIMDDSEGSWAARLDRIFSGQAQIEQWSTASPGPEFALVHVPVTATGGEVIYAAGFAFPAGRPLPSAAELESAAIIALQAVATERSRSNRFLHDIVAQGLSGTGLQIELLRSEIQAGNTPAQARASGIQQWLEDVLILIREFNALE